MPAKIGSTPPLPGLSPAAGRPIFARFDGGHSFSDGGLLAPREIERRLGLAERLAACIDDTRAAGCVQHGVAEILRFRLLMIAAGYEDGNDADTLRHDPVLLMVDSLGAGMGHIASGRMRALALTTAERSPRLPGLPTAIELGLEDRECLAWYAFMAPKGTPGAAVARLNAAINTAATEPAVAERIRGLGADTRAMTPAAQGAFMRAERDKWAAVGRAARVEVQ